MKKGIRKPFIVLCIATMMFAFTAISGMAVNIDLDRSCSMTISAGDFEDISEANVVLDVYKVASAKPDGKYDTYGYTVEGAYAEFADRLSSTSDISTDAWKTLANDVADKTLNQGNSIAKVVDGVPAGQAISNLKPGLYLVVARSQGLNKYVTTVTDDDGNSRVVTIAYSKSHEYRYAPELVSLPTKEVNEKGEHRTDTPGEWVYDLSGATMKAAQSPRYNDLIINKMIIGYDHAVDATFIFSVEAWLRDEKVYDNDVTMVFDSGEPKAITLSNCIPVGSHVVVKEIYTGLHYELDAKNTPEVQEVDMPNPDKGHAEVSYVNVLNDDVPPIPSGSIVNKFKYVETESGSAEWKLIDNTTDNTVESETTNDVD